MEEVPLDVAAKVASCTENAIQSKKRNIIQIAWNCTGDMLAEIASDSTAARVHPVGSHGFTRDSEVELRPQNENHHNSGVDMRMTAVCWDPTKKSVLATGTADNVVRFWDTRSPSKHQSSVRMPEGIPVVMAFSPDGSCLAVISRSQGSDCLTLWDMRMRKVINKLKFGFEINDLCWGFGSEACVYAATEKGNVLTLTNLGQFCSQFQAHVLRTYNVISHPSNKYIATTGADAIVNVFDVEHEVCIATIPRLQQPTHSISFSCDGNFLASVCTEDNRIDVSHVFTGHQVKRIDSPCQELKCVAFHPTQLVLAAAGLMDDFGLLSLYSFGNSSFSRPSR